MLVLCHDGLVLWSSCVTVVFCRASLVCHDGLVLWWSYVVVVLCRGSLMSWWYRVVVVLCRGTQIVFMIINHTTHQANPALILRMQISH